MTTYTRIEACDATLEKMADSLEATIAAITGNDYLRSVNVLIHSHDREDCPCIQLRKEIDLSGHLSRFTLDVAIYVQRQNDSLSVDRLGGEYGSYYDNIKQIQNEIIVPTLFNDGSSVGQPNSNERVYNYCQDNLSVVITHKSTDMIAFSRQNEARIIYSFIVSVSFQRTQ